MDIRVLAALLILGVLCTVEASTSQIQEVDEEFIELIRAKAVLTRSLTKRAHQDSCRSHPCQNGGRCNHIPTPFQTRLGLDYGCTCSGDYSGFFCEIHRPCLSCPENARYCMRTSRDQTGRYCYDNKFQVVVGV